MRRRQQTGTAQSVRSSPWRYKVPSQQHLPLLRAEGPHSQPSRPGTCRWLCSITESCPSHGDLAAVPPLHQHRDLPRGKMPEPRIDGPIAEWRFGWLPSAPSQPKRSLSKTKATGMAFWNHAPTPVRPLRATTPPQAIHHVVAQHGVTVECLPRGMHSPLLSLSI